MGLPTEIGRHREGRFIVLFALTLAFHVTLPLLRLLEYINVLFGLGFIILLGYAGWITVERHRPRVAYLGLMLISLVSTGTLILGHSAVNKVWLAFHAAFVVLIAVLVTRWTIARERVTLDTIFAALSGYYLMGFAWALIYALIERFAVDSFSVDISANLDQAFYFSFATITTLGYGDIVPTSPLTRALVTTEALVGQIYLIVLVARLVAMRTEHAGES